MQTRHRASIPIHCLEDTQLACKLHHGDVLLTEWTTVHFLGGIDVHGHGDGPIFAPAFLCECDEAL